MTINRENAGGNGRIETKVQMTANRSITLLRFRDEVPKTDWTPDHTHKDLVKLSKQSK
jgi:hypothetical protein